MRSMGKRAQVTGRDEFAMLSRVDRAGLFKKPAFGQRPEEVRWQTMRPSGEEFSRCREQCVQRPWGKTVSDVTSGRLEWRNWVIRGGEKFVGFKAKGVLGADCIGFIDHCKGNFGFYPEGDGEPSKGSSRIWAGTCDEMRTDWGGGEDGLRETSQDHNSSSKRRWCLRPGRWCRSGGKCSDSRCISKAKPPVSLKHWIWGMREKAELRATPKILRQRPWRMELPLVEMGKSVSGANLREQTQKFSSLHVILRSWEGSLLFTSGVWEKRPDLEIKVGEMSVYQWHFKLWA